MRPHRSDRCYGRCDPRPSPALKKAQCPPPAASRNRRVPKPETAAQQGRSSPATHKIPDVVRAGVRRIAPALFRDFYSAGRSTGFEKQLAARLIHAHSNLAGEICHRLHSSVARADHMRAEIVALLQINELLVFLLFNALVLRIERTGSLAAAKIGRAHSGENSARIRIRWKGAWAAQDGTRHSGLGEHLPDRHPSPAAHDSWLRQHALGPLKTAEGEIRLVGLRIAAD